MQPSLISDAAHGAGRSRPAVFPYGVPDTSTTGDDASTHGDDASTRWPDAPGASACPECEAATINVQGIADCTGCDWRGPR